MDEKQRPRQTDIWERQDARGGTLSLPVSGEREPRVCSGLTERRKRPIETIIVLQERRTMRGFGMSCGSSHIHCKCVSLLCVTMHFLPLSLVSLTSVCICLYSYLSVCYAVFPREDTMRSCECLSLTATERSLHVGVWHIISTSSEFSLPYM